MNTGLSFKFKVVTTYFMVVTLAAGLCWKTYHLTAEIDAEFAALTGGDLQSLDRLLNLSASPSRIQSEI